APAPGDRLLRARRDSCGRAWAAHSFARGSGADHGTAGGSADPYGRGAPVERLSALGIGLRGTRFHALHVAGLRLRGFALGNPRVPRPPAALRRNTRDSRKNRAAAERSVAGLSCGEPGGGETTLLMIVV